MRRLVRQYDLDITGIHGTGPSGRIRVGDVIGMLGGRADGATAIAPTPRAARRSVRRRDARRGAQRARPTARGGRAQRQPRSRRRAAPPATTVYECDLSRVLSHRKQRRRNNVEVLLDELLPRRVRRGAEAPCRKSRPRRRRTRASACCSRPPTATCARRSSTPSTRRRLGAARVDRRPPALVRSGAARDRRRDRSSDASLLIHHYGLSGSLLATPTPLGAGHVASVGLGRVRRQIVVEGDRRRRSPARRRAVLRHADLPAGSTAAAPREPLPRPARPRARAVARLGDAYLRTAAIESAT